MVESPESIKKVRGRDGIFSVIGLGTTRYAKNSIRAYAPNSQTGRAIGEECPAVESKALADEISVVFALTSGFASFRLLCKYSGAEYQHSDSRTYHLHGCIISLLLSTLGEYRATQPLRRPGT
jgi:hypothetical protein